MFIFSLSWAHLSLSSISSPLLSLKRDLYRASGSLSQAERADEVSIDQILRKHTDKGPLKPVLVQSPFFPSQSVHEEGSWEAQLFKLPTNLFLPKSEGIVSTPGQKTQTQNEEKRGGGCTQWEAEIPGETESVEDWGWLKNKKKSGNRRGRTAGVTRNHQDLSPLKAMLCLCD